MQALIVGAAPVPGFERFYSELLLQAPLVIGVDAGAAFAAALGRVPDISVGDFDSAPTGSRESLAAAGSRVIVHPALKDDTDLDLALGVARAEGCEDLTFTAAFAARLDHTLASIGTLLRAEDLRVEVREPTMTAWLLGVARRRVRLAGEVGSLVSLLAPCGADGVTIEGMAYPLTDAHLEPLSSLGVSNVLQDDSALIEVLSGTALVIAQGNGHPPKVRLL